MDLDLDLPYLYQRNTKHQRLSKMNMAWKRREYRSRVIEKKTTENSKIEMLYLEVIKTK